MHSPNPAPTSTPADSASTPGRSCPLHYRYAPAVFRAAPPPELQGLEVLYVVGGLYGNLPALQRVLAMFEAERGRKRLVFNGDFHWFDADPAVFAAVQKGVLAHSALRGNVETELAAEVNGDEADAGCGCAYPDWVGDEVVSRSNRILATLRRATTAAQRAELAALPMWQTAEVGGLRLGLVHGDACSLAGWGFAQEHLQDAAHRAQVQAWFEQAGVHAFASTHTCLPVFQALHTPPAAPRWVFNNGATGMPNFAGDAAGLLTRLALTPCAADQRRFGVVLPMGDGAVHVDALGVETDTATVQAEFLRQWPEGSDAHASYFTRLQRGPAYTVAQAVRGPQA